jgi:hypothetical protein
MSARLKVRQCLRKQTYGSAADAADAMNCAKRNGVTKGDTHPYLCPWCSWWHWGHKRKKRRV